MTKDEIKKLIAACEIKWYGIHVDPDGEKDVWKGDIEKLAELVEKHTQEQCAKVCAEMRDSGGTETYKDYEDNHVDGYIDGCNECEWAIRNLYN